MSSDSGEEQQMTDFLHRRRTNVYGLATDGKYLYFLQQELHGDIWVMDVVTDEDS